MSIFSAAHKLDSLGKKSILSEGPLLTLASISFEDAQHKICQPSKDEPVPLLILFIDENCLPFLRCQLQTPFASLLIEFYDRALNHIGENSNYFFPMVYSPSLKITTRVAFLPATLSQELILSFISQLLLLASFKDIVAVSTRTGLLPQTLPSGTAASKSIRINYVVIPPPHVGTVREAGPNLTIEIAPDSLNQVRVDDEEFHIPSTKECPSHPKTRVRPRVRRGPQTRVFLGTTWSQLLSAWYNIINQKSERVPPTTPVGWCLFCDPHCAAPPRIAEGSLLVLTGADDVDRARVAIASLQLLAEASTVFLVVQPPKAWNLALQTCCEATSVLQFSDSFSCANKAHGYAHQDGYDVAAWANCCVPRPEDHRDRHWQRVMAPPPPPPIVGFFKDTLGPKDFLIPSYHVKFSPRILLILPGVAFPQTESILDSLTSDLLSCLSEWFGKAPEIGSTLRSTIDLSTVSTSICVIVGDRTFASAVNSAAAIQRLPHNGALYVLNPPNSGVSPMDILPLIQWRFGLRSLDSLTVVLSEGPTQDRPDVKLFDDWEESHRWFDYKIVRGWKEVQEPQKPKKKEVTGFFDFVSSWPRPPVPVEIETVETKADQLGPFQRLLLSRAHQEPNTAHENLSFVSQAIPSHTPASPHALNNPSQSDFLRKWKAAKEIISKMSRLQWAKEHGLRQIVDFRWAIHSDNCLVSAKLPRQDVDCGGAYHMNMQLDLVSGSVQQWHCDCDGQSSVFASQSMSSSLLHSFALTDEATVLAFAPLHSSALQPSGLLIAAPTISLCRHASALWFAARNKFAPE